MRINDLIRNHCLFSEVPANVFFRLKALNESYSEHSSETEKKHIDFLKSYINSIFVKIEPIRAYETNDYYNCVCLTDGQPIFIPVSSYCNFYDGKDIELTFDSVDYTIKNPFMGEISEGYINILKPVNFDSLKNGALFIYHPSYDEFTSLPSSNFYIKINDFKYRTTNGTEYIANAVSLTMNNSDNSNIFTSHFIRNFAMDSKVVNLTNMCILDISNA